MRCLVFTEPLRAGTLVNPRALTATSSTQERHMKKVLIAFAISAIGLPVASAGWVAAAMIAF